MEKLKHIMHPGKEKDDELMYGSGRSSDPLHSGPGTARHVGEGSHLPGSTSGTHQTGQGVSGLGSTSGTAPGPHSSDLANKVDPRVDSDRDGSRAFGTHHPTATSTTGYGAGTGAPVQTIGTRSHVDPLAGNVNKPLPHTPDSFTGAPGSGSTYGSLPDRTIGGAGTAGAIGGLASATGAGHHHQHHISAEAGTYGTSQGGLVHHYHTPHDFDPANPDPRMVDPRISEVIQFGHTPPAALKVAATMPVGTSAAPVAAPPSNTIAGVHHPLRDAALAAGGVTAGVGAHEISTHHGPTHGTGLVGTTTAGYDGSTTASGPHASNIANRLDPRVDSDRDGSRTLGTTGTHHGLAGAGTAAAGVAAYETARHHPGSSGTAGTSGPLSSTAFPYGTTGHVNEPSHVGHHYGRDAGLAGTVETAAIAGSELSRRDRDTEPEYTVTERGEKRHHHKEEKHHHHKDEKHHKEEKSGHGLLGFLHRDKDKHHDVEEDRSRHHSTGAGTTGVGTAAILHNERDDHPHKLHKEPPYEHDDHHPHKLHKDPPPELVAKAQAHPTGTRDLNAPEGRDKFVIEPHTGLPMNIGKYGSGAGGTDGGPVVGYHEDPAHQVTGRIGDRADPNIPGGGRRQDEFVIEPHTGLPMNVGKYGSGAGGTDGGPVVGYHEDPAHHVTGRVGGVDRDAESGRGTGTGTRGY